MAPKRKWGFVQLAGEVNGTHANTVKFITVTTRHVPFFRDTLEVKISTATTTFSFFYCMAKRGSGVVAGVLRC